ncbi:MAG: translation initiation factor IF-2, partial [Candidatus Nanohalobium sp.]
MPRQPILSVLGHVDSGKCVAPDTEIQLSDGSTAVAEELFKEYRENGERIEDEEGEVYSLEEGPKLLGVDDGEIVRCEAENIWKLEKDKLLEFELSDGSEVEVTPEHPFLVVQDSELKFKAAEELRKSDMVAVPEKLPKDEKDLKELKEDTLKVLSENKRILCFTEPDFSEELKKNGEKISEKLLTNHLTDCRNNDRFRLQDVVTICSESSIGLEEAYENITSIKQSTLKQRAGSASKRIELPATESEFEDLAYSVGMMLGDGSREARKLYNNSEVLRTKFKGKIENAAGVETQVNTYESQVDEVYIKCGKTLSKFFEILFDFPVEQKSQSIKLSEYAQRSPKNILANLISGYFDADGYVNKEGGVQATSASEEMINSLKTALKQFGISAYTSQDEGYHTIHITGKENLRQFTQIGFKHPDKRERFQKHREKSEKNPVTGHTPVEGEEIQKARQEIGASPTEIDIPYQKRYEEYDRVSKSYIKDFVQEIKETRNSPEFKLNKDEKTDILESLKKQPSTREEIYEEESINHPRLLNHLLSLESQGLIDRSEEKIQITQKGEEILEKWKEDKLEKLQQLEKIADSDLKFAEVSEITEKEGGTVYDFTTEANTFIAEDVIVHNTTILDEIRESRIVEGEAGGITQMIGATEVPLKTVEEVCGGLLNSLDTELTIPGLLFIDTPGHAAFSSLRKRGGSISDIAVLVIDIEEGVQPQTEEAIQILKESGTPFVVALNKIDKLPGWKTTEKKCFTSNIQQQSDKVQQELDEKIYELMGELNEYDIVADRFDRVDNFQKKVAMVPTSAVTGEGMPELLMVLSGLSQNYLADQLEVHEGIGKGTVLEVTQQKGLGTTIDAIIYDGKTRIQDKLVYGTKDGVKVTEIRALLEPRPLEEIRLDKQYQEVDEITPAAGVKISGKDLENVMSGAPIRTASEEDLEEAKEEVREELETTEFETHREGVVVKADSLGSLEAMMREVEKAEIPVQKAEVGKVTKSDLIEVQNEEPENQAVLAFNTGMTDQAAEIDQEKDIPVFSSEVIYEIIDNYNTWKNKLQEEQREKALKEVTRPAKIQAMPDHVFRKSDPAVIGVKVLEGVLTPGCALMDENGEKIGTLKSIQEENEKIEEAERGSQVAASIQGATVGRNLEK